MQNYLFSLVLRSICKCSGVPDIQHAMLKVPSILFFSFFFHLRVFQWLMKHKLSGFLGKSYLLGKGQFPTAISFSYQEICMLTHVQKNTTFHQASSQLCFSVLPTLLLIIMPLCFCVSEANEVEPFTLFIPCCHFPEHNRISFVLFS